MDEYELECRNTILLNVNQSGCSALAYLYKTLVSGLGKSLVWSRMVVLVSQQFTDDPKFQVLNTTASGITSLTLAEKELWLGSKLVIV